MELLIIFCAKYLIWAIAALFVLFFFFARRRIQRRLLIVSAISLPLAYALGWLASSLYYSVRPFVESGLTPLFAHAANNGFPSDHMLLGAALATIVLVFNRPSGLFLWLLALAVGWARVAAGVHHGLDIMASAAISTVIVVLVFFCFQSTRWYRG